MVRRHGREFILDAMSSFGGIPMSMESTGAHYLISSANKCIQGVPGFGFVVADSASLESTKGRARSHSLDLHHQWHEMETKGGKWRFTSPTHVVKAFAQALDELESEGGGSGGPKSAPPRIHDRPPAPRPALLLLFPVPSNAASGPWDRWVERPMMGRLGAGVRGGEAKG